MNRVASGAALLVLSIWLSACHPVPPPVTALPAAPVATITPTPRPGAASPVRSPVVRFQDVTRQAGLHFTHYNGGSGHWYMPEEMGAGCAWIDYDNSGRQSLLLLNDNDLWSHPSATGHFPALYRNNGDGTFTDVTRPAGLDVSLYAMGVAVGDYDNDGYPDIFLTTCDGNRLFHNRGDGTFEDVTDKAGVRGPSGPVPWSTSAAFVDYDNDGRLDIFVTYYVKWTVQHDFYRPKKGFANTYNLPISYPGQTSRLFHNLGHGRFEDVTARSGIEKSGKGLGVSIVMRPDGWPDLFVANDTVPNFYFVNQKNGTFREEGLRLNVATAEDGKARAGMGTDVADADNDGHLDLVAGNLPGQGLSMWRHTRFGNYIESAARTHLMASSRLTSDFGLFFFDYDLDGWPDLLVACGYLNPNIPQFANVVTFAERPLLFHNLTDGHFEEVAGESGLSEALVGRGAAWADYDGDGWPDVVITSNQGPVHLFRNLGRPDHHGLELRLEGTTCNRSAIGAQVYVRIGYQTQHQWVKSGSSYCSQSQLPLLFGLGTAAGADRVEVQWPGSDHREDLGPLRAGWARVVQGRGVTQFRPWPDLKR